ncbi:MAG: hypothetical protein BWY42_01711 [Candidatus Omnitrophica bacterium ADurb.Bin277]|nr:MAG: hypothetical protein BWY42_01711 [Candidatus Omnitrophica bacterium ADurb.Bin277]
MRLIVRRNDLEKHAGLISRFQKSGWEIVVR